MGTKRRNPQECVCKDSKANRTYHKKEDVCFEYNMSSSRSESSDDVLSITDELDSDDERTHDTEDLIQRIKTLQQKVRSMEKNAERNANEMLNHAQMQCERDTQMYWWINALVLDKIFSFKKFITNQRDLDDFTGNSSLGIVMKIEKPEQLPFWNAYKEIVADAIANWWMTITNDLKKIVWSKYKIAYIEISQIESNFMVFWLLSGIKTENRTLTEQGKEVPIHRKLPTMADILKLWQAPCASNKNTTFTFVIEHLARAVIGQQKWKTARCYAPMSKHVHIGWGIHATGARKPVWVVDGCRNSQGWKRKIHRQCAKQEVLWMEQWGDEAFQPTQLIAKVRNNQNKQYSKEVDDATTRTLAERYQTLMAVRGRNSHKHHWHVPDHSEDEANDEENDDSIIPEDELILLADATSMEMVWNKVVRK
jgi:hypothetical protein